MSRYRIAVPKRELAQAIIDHCMKDCPLGGRKRKDHCGNQRCHLWRYRNARQQSPDNYHLFKHNDPVEFENRVKAISRTMPHKFFWSELRQACTEQGVSPIENSWWGAMTRRTWWRAWFKKTGFVGTSSTPSRRHGNDVQYRRRDGFGNG